MKMSKRHLHLTPQTPSRSTTPQVRVLGSVWLSRQPGLGEALEPQILRCHLRITKAEALHWEHSNPCFGLPSWLSGQKPTCQCRRPRFDLYVRKLPWRRNGNTLQCSWQENPHRQRSLEGYSPRGRRVRYDLPTKTTAMIHVLTCLTGEPGVWEPRMSQLPSVVWEDWVWWYGRFLALWASSDIHHKGAGGAYANPVVKSTVTSALPGYSLVLERIYCRDSLVATVTFVVCLGPSSVGGNVYII